MIQILKIKPISGKKKFSVDYEENGKIRHNVIVFSKVLTATGKTFETLGSRSFRFNESVGANPDLKKALFSVIRSEASGLKVKFPIQVKGNGKM